MGLLKEQSVPDLPFGSGHSFGRNCRALRASKLLLRLIDAVPVLAPPFWSPQETVFLPWERRPLASECPRTRGQNGDPTMYLDNSSS